MKKTRNISLDLDVVDAVDEETEKGRFCLSKWANSALKIVLKDTLKIKK